MQFDRAHWHSPSLTLCSVMDVFFPWRDAELPSNIRYQPFQNWVTLLPKHCGQWKLNSLNMSDVLLYEIICSLETWSKTYCTSGSCESQRMDVCVVGIKPFNHAWLYTFYSLMLVFQCWRLLCPFRRQIRQSQGKWGWGQFGMRQSDQTGGLRLA